MTMLFGSVTDLPTPAVINPPAPTPAPVPTPAPPPAGASEHVTRSGANLMCVGRVFKFVGFNDFSIPGCHTGTAHSNEKLDDYFSRLRPRSVTRVWAFHTTGRANIARIVAKAEQWGQKVMLVLGEGAQHCGIRNFYITEPEFYRTRYVTEFLPWIRTIVGDHKNSPAVIWEIMNEPGQIGGAGTQAEMKAFYNACAYEIKAIDPIHVVSSGTLDSYQSFQFGEAGYRDVHDSPYIDLMSMHEYESWALNNLAAAERFAQNKRAADALGIPIFVGEFGVTSPNQCVTLQQRGNRAVNKYTAYLDAGAAGALYWSVSDPANQTGDACNVAFAAMEPYTSPVVTMTKAYTHPQLPVY